MTENTRRQQIEAMPAEEPDDTFLQYALAMELEKDSLLRTSIKKHHHCLQMEELSYFIEKQKLMIKVKDFQQNYGL